MNAQPLTVGIYRQRQDIAGPRGVAHIRRVDDDRSGYERYTVTFFRNEAPQGEVIGVCWRYGIPTTDVVLGPHYDGGWTRALAIAEHYVNEGGIAL